MSVLRLARYSSLCALLALATTACSKDVESAPESREDEYPGIGQGHFALLSSNCTVSGGVLTIQVNAGETAILSLNTANGMVSANATQAGGAACEVTSTSSITVSPGTAGDHALMLDFSNGLFCQATTSTPKITVNLGTGSNDTLTVRGTALVDHFYFGAGTASGRLFNSNGGASAPYDSFPDVSITGAEKVVVSSGAGADILDGSGLFGTTGAYPTALSFFGGADNDTLTGGNGNDLLSGDSGNDQLNGGAGANVYSAGTANDGTDIITVTSGASDTVDYSKRFNAVVANLNNSATSGETGENDTIPDTVSVVLGGSGNDTLSAAGSSRSHTLKGGAGNDTLTGGSGNDTLLGGDGVLQVDGDDVLVGAKATADYSARTQALTITINASGSGGADANDGDATATRHAQTAQAAASGAHITAATNTVSGLSGMNAGSVGHTLILAGTASGHDDGSYRISAVTNATTVVLNASDTAANAAWADDAGAAWTFAEDAGAEKDEVRCANVIGSASAANTITGDSADNRIQGGAAADVLTGGAGNDVLMGLALADDLYGGAGDDSLLGGQGNDRLFGGDGNDVLEGDDGSDAFQCDGKNDAMTLASAPGNVDYSVDIVLGAPDNDTRANGNDCEY